MKILPDGKWSLCALTIVLLSLQGCDSSSEQTETGTDDAAPIRGIGDTGVTVDMGSSVDSSHDGDASVEPDMTIVSPYCDREISFGIRGDVNEAAPSPSHSARAIWSGTEWAITWIQDIGDDEPGRVLFQRYNDQAQAIGEPTEIGRTEQSILAMVSTESGYAVVYANARRTGDQYSGLRIRPIGPDGRPAVSEIDVEATFDVHSVDFKWAPFAGGMLVYARGRSGAGGLYSNALDRNFTLQGAVRISEATVTSAAVSFGDGGWGATWLESNGDGTGDLHFSMLDESGGLVGDIDSVTDAGVGRLAMAYGGGTFAIAWSRRQNDQTIKPYLTLVEAGGDVLETSPVSGPTDTALAADVEWMGSPGFAIAWLGQGPDRHPRTGVSRLSTVGTPLPHYALPIEDGHAHRSVSLAGNQGKLGIWVTVDPTPSPVGYSETSFVQYGVLGRCN